MVGNTPNFSKLDVLRCFLRLNKNISRQELSKDLELGEGTVRSILDILKSKELLDSARNGHFLTMYGSKTFSRVMQSIMIPKEFSFEEIYPDNIKVGIVLKESLQLHSTYKLRDVAVKNGAEGAMILKFKDSLETPESGNKEYFKKLEKIFNLEKGNLLIISFSGKRRLAELGALSVAAELSHEIRNFLKEV